MTGQIISHYRVLEKLGEGGMGVVYKAEDTKLRRAVALKFLPPHAAENRERFLREAQAAASLNHPNICTIHEIDDEHGFIAMEFIDGPSVKEKIDARPLPLEEALDIAMQICAALQAAHEKGIVHRDIKPANVMLTAQGQVKIMDFGLAQVGDRTRLTKSGSSLGTPAYMSPEQAQGSAVDRRTDIWSLGVALYEMIAGRQPFPGDSAAACTYSIVHTEPEVLTELRSGIPKDLDRIIGKLLAKAPDNRYQHVDDLLTDLRQIRKSAGGVHTPPFSRIDNKANRPATGIARLPWRFAGVIVFLIVGGLLVRAWLDREQSSWTPSPPTQLTRDSGLNTDPVISRDGKLLAFASDRGGDGNLDIWVQNISRGEARRLASHPSDDRQPDISPDGGEVVFRSERDGGGIYSIPTLGGSAKLIIKGGHSPRFSPDGSRIAYSLGPYGGTTGVYTPATASVQTLAPNLLVTGPATWSPDGKSLVFAGAEAYLKPLYLWICDANGGKATQLSPRPITDVPAEQSGNVRTVTVAWFREQLILSMKQGDSSNLWAGKISPGSRRLASELRRITLGSGNEVAPSVSADGKLVFANQIQSADIWEAALNKDASSADMRRLTQDRAQNYHPSLSANGTRMAYVSNRAGSFDVWVRDLVNGTENPLTHTAKAKASAVISRDGNQVATWDTSSVYIESASGGAPRLLCERCGRAEGWAADGKIIGLYGGVPGGIGAWDSATGLFTKLTAHPVRHSTAPNLSPDGRWLTFHTVDNQVPGKSNRQVVVIPFADQWVPPANWTLITDGTALDREPRWSPDGNLIYFVSDRDGFRCIWACSLDAKTKKPLGPVYPVLHLHNARLSLSHLPSTGSVRICPIGGKLIFAMGELTANLWLTELR